MVRLTPRSGAHTSTTSWVPCGTTQATTAVASTTAMPTRVTGQVSTLDPHSTKARRRLQQPKRPASHPTVSHTPPSTTSQPSLLHTDATLPSHSARLQRRSKQDGSSSTLALALSFRCSVFPSSHDLSTKYLCPLFAFTRVRTLHCIAPIIHPCQTITSARCILYSSFNTHSCDNARVVCGCVLGAQRAGLRWPRRPQRRGAGECVLTVLAELTLVVRIKARSEGAS